MTTLHINRSSLPSHSAHAHRAAASVPLAAAARVAGCQSSGCRGNRRCWRHCQLLQVHAMLRHAAVLRVAVEQVIPAQPEISCMHTACNQADASGAPLEGLVRFIHVVADAAPAQQPSARLLKQGRDCSAHQCSPLVGLKSVMTPSHQPSPSQYLRERARNVAGVTQVVRAQRARRTSVL